MAPSLTEELRVKAVDGAELRFLLMSHIKGCAFHIGKGEDVLYGPSEQHDYVLKLLHKKNDVIYKAEPGLGLTDGLLGTLAQAIQTELIDCTGTLVGQEILLSESPIAGYVNYDNRVQIQPAPIDAPRPAFVQGLSARHPFLFQVRFPASKNSTVNGFRRFKALSELELALTALLRGSVRRAIVSNTFHWVVADRDSNTPSVFMRDGYKWPALTAETNQFSDHAGLSQLTKVPAPEYYAREPWTLGSTLNIPDNLDDQFARFYALPAVERLAWHRACYWLHHSSYVRTYSTSAAFATLVIAVEALMPGVGGKKGSKFEKFIAEFAPNHGASHERLQKLYDIRAHVLHGNMLMYSDREPLLVGITPGMTQSLKDFSEMRRIAKTVLVNWLTAKASPVGRHYD